MSMQIHAGPEIGVASTKAFSCQLSILYFLVIKAAKEKGIIDNNQEAELVKSILQLPSIIVDALSLESEIKLAAQELSKASNAIFLGRGAMYPLALEGALKLKEISYIHAEGYASGELKHGPIALVDENMPVIVLAPKDELFDKTVSNMHEVMARGGKVAVVHNGIIENFKKLRDELISNGANFQSETDTETIAQLCMSFIDGGDDPKIAAKKT